MKEINKNSVYFQHYSLLNWSTIKIKSTLIKSIKSNIRDNFYLSNIKCINNMLNKF